MKQLAFVLIFLLTAFVAHANPLDKYPKNGQCEWSAPGSSKYMLPLANAVDRLTYIPERARIKLAARLDDPRKALNADDHLLIGRDKIEGESAYYRIRDMNGGDGHVCWGEVTRNRWKDLQYERAMLFCEEGWCLAYFSVCRNVALATFVSAKRPPMAAEPLLPPPIVADAPPSFQELSELPTTPDDSFPPSRIAQIPSGSAIDLEATPSTFDELRTPDNFIPTAWRSFGWIFGSPVFSVSSTPDGVMQPVPEPSTYLLMALGLLALAWRVRRNCRRRRRRWA